MSKKDWNFASIDGGTRGHLKVHTITDTQMSIQIHRRLAKYTKWKFFIVCVSFKIINNKCFDYREKMVKLSLLISL